MIRLFIALMAVVAALGLGSGAHADPAPAINVDAGGVAMRGFDPVGYFTEGRPIEGSSGHQLVWNGVTWRFATAQSRAAFAAAPERYAPQFGGYCAWAISQHYLAPGDPKYWKIVDGKLYLNANARAKQLWEADQSQAIARGHANWPAVLTNNQDGTSR